MRIIKGLHMKLRLFLLISAWLLLSLTPSFSAQAKTPKEIGGFKLGTSIGDYEFVSYHNYLKQVVIEDIGAFRKGVIEYGICKRPGEIVKIKLKYKDKSKSFFRKLLKEYKKQLGKPDKYTGDAFGIIKSWKWFFTDEKGLRVSLSLQYNKEDYEESMGSVVKMSLPDRIEEERQCFNKVCEERQEDAPVQQKKHLEAIIPR